MRELSPRAQKAATTKNKIIKSATKLFRRYGYNQVHVQDILKDCGVSVGTFYHYFESKAELLAEISLDINEPFVYDESIDYQKDDCRQCVLNHFQTYSQFIQTLPTDTVIELYLGNYGNRTFLEHDRAMYQVLEKIIQNFQMEHKIIAGDAMEIVINLFIIARGVIYHWIISDFKFNLSVKMEELISIAFTYYSAS